MAYKHGTYGELRASKVKSSTNSDTVVVYVGTAPVNLVRGYANAGIINAPIKLSNMVDAQAKIGYAADWDAFTLCEAVAEHFDNTVGNVGPIYVINVLDPTTHRKSENTSISVAFSGGRGEFASSTIILDTIAIQDKVEGTDYEVAYNFNTGKVVITSIGETQLSGNVSVSFRTPP